MGNNFAEQQRLAQQRQQKADKDLTDLRRGLAGVDVWSNWGQIGKRIHDGTPSSLPVASPSPVRPVRSPVSQPQRLPQPKSPPQPWLPGVDSWAGNVPERVLWTLTLGGALCGFCLGISKASLGDGLLFGFLGAIAGFSLINLLAKAFKVLIGVAFIGLIGLILYALLQASTGH
jgi:hypothetical protein